MSTVIGRLAADECGFVVSTELVLIATVGVLGLLTAFTCLRDAVNAELQDVAAAIGALNQSYSYAGMHGCFRPWCGAASWTAGSAFTDLRDEQPAPFLDDGPCPVPVPSPLPAPVPCPNPQPLPGPVLPCPPPVVEPPACPPPAVCLPLLVCPVLPVCPPTPPCAATVCPPAESCGCQGKTSVSGCSSCAPVLPGPAASPPALPLPPLPPAPIAVGTLPPPAPVRIPAPGFNPIYGPQGFPPPLAW